jgi:PIN domain nuclease of toxin-antitoxin system
VWWTAGLPGLSASARAELNRATRIGVCTFSCWEVAMLAARQRIRLDREVCAWVATALVLDRVEALALDAEIAVSAALLPTSFPGDPADRVIYATARAYRAPLVTRDVAIQAYDPTGTLW